MRRKRPASSTLKVGYNKVFGYYIEVSNSFKDQVPADYIRKQTLVNGERYITQELKDLEHEVLTAHDRDAALEYDLFTALRTEAAGQVTRVQLAASLIAQLDTLCAFAEVAAQNHYCRPEVDESGVIEITAGRHPVVEKVRGDAFFVPNDTHMGAKEDRVAIITGPNMAGKSTYMRQVALIVLMAQVGCFVPRPAGAHRRGGPHFHPHRRFSDDLAAGQSTFMVEMTEVSELLRCATKNSLLILDEIGRGTSTFDGMSIARAVLEHIATGKLRAKTLFATHYHELTDAGAGTARRAELQHRRQRPGRRYRLSAEDRPRRRGPRATASRWPSWRACRTRCSSGRGRSCGSWRASPGSPTPRRRGRTRYPWRAWPRAPWRISSAGRR